MKYFLLLTLAAMSLMAADATGKWSGTITISTPDEGEKTHGAHLELKQEGTKVTGTAGPTADEQSAIQNGKLEDGTLTFDLSRDEGVMRFKLKYEEDEIKGEVTREHDGQMQTAKLAVKRDK